MSRSFAIATFVGSLFGLIGYQIATAEEPTRTKTVDITSSEPDLGKLNSFEGTGLILGTKEWERLAFAWGIKNPPKVDFNKEMLLVGTWRGTDFKFLSEVKNGDLQVELVGNTEVKPGFRFRIISLKRDGITKFQGKELPKP